MQHMKTGIQATAAGAADPDLARRLGARPRFDPSAEALRRTVDAIVQVFEAAEVDFEELTPFEARVLMLWNQLELWLEQSQRSSRVTAASDSHAGLRGSGS